MSEQFEANNYSEAEDKATPPQSGAPATAPNGVCRICKKPWGTSLRFGEDHLSCLENFAASPSASGDTVAAPSDDAWVGECLDMVREVLEAGLGTGTIAPMFYPEAIRSLCFKRAKEVLQLALGTDDVQGIIDRFNSGERFNPAAPISESAEEEAEMAELRENAAQYDAMPFPKGFDFTDILEPASESETPPQQDSIEKILDGLKRSHLVVDDCWYSCPKSGDCCNDHEPDECNCGADKHNAKLGAIRDSFSRLTRDHETAKYRLRLRDGEIAKLNADLRALRAEVSRLRLERDAWNESWERDVARYQAELEKADDFSNHQESELRRLRETALTPEEAAHLLSELPDLTHHIADPFITKLRATLAHR